MPQGTIKKLIADKGFGFIDGERGDLFFHHSAVEATTMEALSIGQAVTYNEGRGPKGPALKTSSPLERHEGKTVTPDEQLDRLDAELDRLKSEHPSGRGILRLTNTSLRHVPSGVGSSTAGRSRTASHVPS